MQQPLLHEVCTKAFGSEFGDHCLITSSVLETDPGYFGQELHRDYDGLPLSIILRYHSSEAMPSSQNSQIREEMKLRCAFLSPVFMA